ncbi:uncharacterized protein LOC113213925 [Frankliniella occidentalis]|uniref:Uncharacterized protein LOC113213925 n=1 Tax=Frankliniella occidentalis TaxID=133901 RepID=A0A6J1TB93_FRAOC|nr:uncharacterized protein LOC113213925 [Frankliniella occidentalis]
MEALNRQLDASVAQLRQLEEALEQVQRGAADDEGTSQEQLQLAVQLEESHRLLNNKWSVVSEEQDGSTWKADVQLGGFGDTLRPLLLQLREDGLLVQVDDVAVSSSPDTYVGPPTLAALSIKRNDLSEGDLKVNEILRNKRRLEYIRVIDGLRGEGSDRLLRIIASHPLHIQELKFSDKVEPKVLEEVQKMSSLKRLNIDCVRDRDDYPDLPLQLEELMINRPSAQQLYCMMRMPALQSLTVNNYSGPNITFTPSQYRKLRWLGVISDIDHKPTMLSLIRAHASSLLELRLFCTVNRDDGGYQARYYFPDLGRNLAACDLLHLRRLVLRRPHNIPCTDVAGCLMQLQDLRGLLPRSVEVVCDACRPSVLE